MENTLIAHRVSVPVYIENCVPPLPATLPRAVQEIAEVIGRERALFLIGQLPRCYVRDKRYNTRASSKGACRVVMYVPKRLRPDHPLVAILGWQDAEKLTQAFGGEILCPPTMWDVTYRPFRDQSIVNIYRVQRVPVGMLAQWFDVTEQRIRQVLEAAGQTPQEARRTPANDNRAP